MILADYYNTAGDKRYELSNHLGNVLVVVNDKKLPGAASGTIPYYNSDIASYSDYDPFGMPLPYRQHDTPAYRYGFQGQEKDDEIKGEGNSLNYTFRMHDPRVGRFFAVDPLFKEYPELTPFQFASNSPIDMVELEGMEGGWVVEKGAAVYRPGPVLKSFDSEASARKAASMGMKTPDQLKSAEKSYQQFLARAPKLAKPQAELRSDGLEAQVNKFRGVNPGLAISRGIIDGAQEAPGIILPEMFFSKAAEVYESYKVFKQSQIALKAIENVEVVSEGTNLALKFKDGWSSEQKISAVIKTQQLSEAKTVVTNVPKRAANLRGRFVKAGNEIRKTEDVDHCVDLQLGGADCIETNTQALDASVNRSLGKQINTAIKDLPEGTIINKVEIK